MKYRRIQGLAYPENVYSTIKNATGSSIAKGSAVVWDATALDGFSVMLPTTATLSLLVGVLVETIAAGAYGSVCIYGFRGAAATITAHTAIYGALVQNDGGGGSDIAVGDILVPVNGQAYFARSAASDGKTGLVMAMQAYTKGTQVVAEKAVFVRCM